MRRAAASWYIADSVLKRVQNYCGDNTEQHQKNTAHLFLEESFILAMQAQSRIFKIVFQMDFFAKQGKKSCSK
jgi:hypothetical protein